MTRRRQTAPRAEQRTRVPPPPTPLSPDAPKRNLTASASPPPPLSTGRPRGRHRPQMAAPIRRSSSLKSPRGPAPPAYDILRSEPQPLGAIFAPESVAVIGATDRPGSVGRTVLWNLISSPFGGTVFPINPRRRSVLGIEAHPSVRSLPEPVDLAVIVTPAHTIPAIVGECVAVGVRGAIILSAGFKEAGKEGVALEERITAQLAVAGGSLRVIGPNCLGVMNPLTGLNATFASTIARPGNVGFVSQSGALCTAVLDWSLGVNVGFSAFLSVGSMLDVHWGDLITYLGDDPRTHSIVVYMESVGDARAFLSAAREVALTKPIIVIKAGRTAEAAKAAASHTGTLAGSDAVLDAAFRRCGVLRVREISEMFDIAEILCKGDKKLPKGPRLTVLTNAGGPGVLATDALVAGGGQLATLSEETMAELNEFLPAPWSHGNPIDILGDADPVRYGRALEVALKDPNSDGLLVILTPQAMTDPTVTAEELRRVSKQSQKPILASWMGGSEVEGGKSVLNRANIATYAYPDSAADTFNYLWKYKRDLEHLYETPSLLLDKEIGGMENGAPANVVVQDVIDAALGEGRTLLSEVESKAILSAYGIPTVASPSAHTEDEAVRVAEDLGYPVVVKLLSKTVTHKTDVGGVHLNLYGPMDVRAAYQGIRKSVTETVGPEAFGGVSVQPMISRDAGHELIVGSSTDPQFGPVILFGTGGSLVEVFQDTQITLPPLSTTLARQLMSRTKIYRALQGVRGRGPADVAALEKLLVRIGQLALEQKRIDEMDINPLLVSSKDARYPILALDARIKLHGRDRELESLPRPAIRPYPTQWVLPWTLEDGTGVRIRPIRPEDEPLIVDFHKSLSERSVYMRYFHPMKFSMRTTHERLIRICHVDYDKDVALVVDRRGEDGEYREIVAAGRLSRKHAFNESEFAILVADAYQRRGIGFRLLKQMVQIGRDERLECITAEMLPENRAMQQVSEKVGFHLTRREDFIVAKIRLKGHERRHGA
ncbi:unnamed protein product [Ostreobium quekettii]|uniref:Acetyl CoA synthetase subunit alpha n=1 Tax=Ostreobium quekettii TaxID=121088 RepID=A0A8S1IWG6_9CHLO|nr:unnamed protein product [Ostreobium quekettii]